MEIMKTTSKWLAIVAAAFVAGSFVASSELRAFAANTVRSIDIMDGEVKTADLANNAVTAGKIKDNEVKAAEIATDAVGAAELQGVSKLLFGQCSTTDAIGQKASGDGGIINVFCKVNGADTDDSVIATLNGDTNICFDVAWAEVAASNTVQVAIRNNCPNSLGERALIAGDTLAVIVYDK
jgi:hypothetical protein